ncbi:MAG TPA: RagB/SusD family nutrient uptake outer membrane protein [Prolixibacteraceae bacterium]|nr:RagB/SusD family nutrient uptake outer membrane protein [Prolixibacteraceae bacterium]
MKKILLFISITLFFAGCGEEFLEKTPTTSLVVENFYQTPNDATQALTAVYNMLLRDDYWSPFFYSEMASDNAAGGAGSGDGGGATRIDRGMQWPEANAHEILWRTYYGAIYRANTYIENQALIDWSGKENLQNQYLAEARFIRAYYHFSLAQFFGEVPALEKTIAPNIVPERTPAEDLYDFILQDLLFAADNALAAPYNSMDFSNWGRATRWAAKAMIGRVFLYYTGYYNKSDLKGYTSAQALEQIEDVINNSGHDLVPVFASLWRTPTYSELGDIGQYAGEINKECVWSVTFNLDRVPTVETFHRMVGPRGYNVEPYGNGWGYCPVVPGLWKLFDDADTRKKASILSWDDEGLTFDWEANTQAQYSGYNCKKYMIAAIGTTNEVTSMGGDWQSKGFEDRMVIRFSEVLLMGAELRSLVNGAGDGTALQYLNRVRERAFGNSSKNYTSATIDNIMLERRLELCFEGLRYWDILRSCKGDFSKLTDILTYVDDTDGGDYANTMDLQSLDVDGSNFVDKKGLFQLPQSELDLMDGIIEQNPGYE